MNLKVVARVVSAILVVVGLCMLTSVAVAWLMHDPHHVVLGLLWSSLLTIVFGVGGSALFRGHQTVRFREGFGIVTFSWLAASVFGAIPLYWLGHLTVIDALFETVSGFTTTGASILDDIESLPRGLLYWRSLTHWLGGMGIVVLSLAILPILGIGGMQLYKAEAPGPTTDQLTPRIANAAKILWGVYLLLTVLETMLLMLGGMTLFDAWCHTCATLATGGFSTRQASIKAFDSAYIDWVIAIFMFLAGCNFVLHLRGLLGRPKAYWENEELRFYVWVCLGSIAVIAAALWFGGRYERQLFDILRHSSFTVLSIITTTGFCTEDFDQWPLICRMLLICLMFIGGCGGSTAGGMKVSRVLLLLKYGSVQIQRCFYPRSLVNVRLDDKRVGDATMDRILGFFFIFVSLFAAVTLLICLIEPGLTSGGPAPGGSFSAIETAASSAIATLGNIGPGLGHVGPYYNYGWMLPQTKILLMFSMLVGRLEVYTVLVLLLPTFWRQ